MPVCRECKHMMAWLCCRLGRYEDAETRLWQAVKLADGLHGSRTPEEITLSFVKALEVILESLVI